MLFGVASVAQSVLSHGAAGTMLSINISWGFAVTMGIFVSGGISGGHLNPAVSVAQAVIGKFEWKKVPFYVLSQFLGSFLASVVVYLVYYDALNAFDGGSRAVTGVFKTAGIWATYPQPYLSIWGAFFDQVIGTAGLLIGVNAITDEANMRVPQNLIPFFVGLLVLIIGSCFGFNCGYAINPARDLAPRLFTCIAGWGIETFSADNYFWIPIVGPLVGGVVGAGIYRIFVEFHRTDKKALAGDSEI